MFIIGLGHSYYDLQLTVGFVYQITIVSKNSDINNSKWNKNDQNLHESSIWPEYNFPQCLNIFSNWTYYFSKTKIDYLTQTTYSAETIASSLSY